MRIDGARIASARSFERFAICRTFTPGAGSISNCVTTGPVVRPTSSPSTRNVRSASMSLTPIASSSRLLASLLCGGTGASSSGDGSSSPAHLGLRRRLDRRRRSRRRDPPRPRPSIFFRRFRLVDVRACRRRRPANRRPAIVGSIAGISSGDGSSASARSPSARLTSPFLVALSSRRFGARRVGSPPGTRHAAAGDPTIARIGFHASVAAISTDAASATTTHAPNAPNQLRHQSGDRAPPQMPAPRSRRPAQATRSARAPARRAGAGPCPAKKIIHERSVSRLEPAEQTQRVHRRNERNQNRRRPAEERARAASRADRPTTPTLCLTLTPVRA